VHHINLCINPNPRRSDAARHTDFEVYNLILPLARDASAVFI
jgi:hypothetical protein